MKKFLLSFTKCESCGSHKVIRDIHDEERCGNCYKPRKRALEKMETK